MHCVWNAYKAHLGYLGLETTKLDWNLYLGLRKLYGIKGFTKGGVIPTMMQILAMKSGLTVVCQHSLYRKAHHLADADNTLQRFAIRHTDFGEFKRDIELVPAIYTLIDINHAVFSLKVPPGIPTLAIQIRG